MVRLSELFGRLKVKNTFVEVGVENDDTIDAVDWKQQSEPALFTEKLLGSSFARVLDAKHSDLKLGSSSFTKNTSFVASVPEIESVPELLDGSGNESTDVETSDFDGNLPTDMARQVTEESWPELDERYNLAHEQDLAPATSVVQAPHNSRVEAIAMPQEQGEEENSADQNLPQAKSKARRRRKRDSLIDKAAKEQRQQPVSNSLKSCSQCGGSCEPNFKFCQFCGMAI